jgi:hypothetical protein
MKPFLCLALGLLLTGCLTQNEEPGRIGGATRFYENGIYTDLELGYSVRVPKGWSVGVGSGEGAAFDLRANRKEGGLRAWHLEATAAEPLEAYVAHRTGENSYADSETVHPVEMRGGVPVIVVEDFNEYQEYDSMESEWKTISVERRRILYFARAGRMVTIYLYDESSGFTAAADFAAIDSSLTFF